MALLIALATVYGATVTAPIPPWLRGSSFRRGGRYQSTGRPLAAGNGERRRQVFGKCRYAGSGAADFRPVRETDRFVSIGCAHSAIGATPALSCPGNSELTQ